MTLAIRRNDARRTRYATASAVSRNNSAALRSAGWPDARIDQRDRRTTKERREEYQDMMDQRAALRDEFEKERRAGKWSVDREIDGKK